MFLFCGQYFSRKNQPNPKTTTFLYQLNQINFMQKIVISLGGSVVIPDKLDIPFLKSFKKLITSYKNKRFIIIVGGGKLARNLQNKAKQIKKPTNEELDWLGIYATRINALTLKNLFNLKENIITNPNNPLPNKPILIGAGWKPGFSTDYDAILIAKNIKAKKVINMTNVPYLYDKDPKKSNAKPITNTTWKQLRKLVGKKWSPGLNMPFDPIAAKLAEKLKLKLLILGKDINNLKKAIDNKEFKGTIIKNG